MTEYIKFVDVTKCNGCRACMVSCKNWNDLPAEPEAFHGSYQSHEKITANTWNVLTFHEQKTTDGTIEWLFRHSACLHCIDAACEKVCPPNAISYTPYGSVVIDYDTCIGCGYCEQHCPFEAIHLRKLSPEEDVNGTGYRAQKCTFCTDRLENGLQPACSVACPTDAILFGEKDEMLQLAQQRLDEVKDRYPQANIYNPPGVGGTHTIYLLTDKPRVYGLPENPQVPLTAKVWKDYAQPISKGLIGVTLTAVIGAYISNTLFNKKDRENGTHAGGEHHEQQE